MATIAENLLELQQAKSNIKSAIEGKGQDLTNVPFTQYGEKIAEIQTGNVDLSETTATADDVLQGKEFFNASGEKVTGTFINPLQWKCDNMKSLRYEFYETDAGLDVTPVPDFMNSLDTSMVTNFYRTFYRYKGESVGNFSTISATNMQEMFNEAIYLKELPTGFVTDNVTTLERAFNNTRIKTTPVLNLNKVTTMSSAFYGSDVETVNLINTTNVQNWGSTFWGCSYLTELNIDTRSGTYFYTFIAGCRGLITVNGLDFRSVTSSSGLNNLMSNTCKNITNFFVKNIPQSIRIGSGSGTGSTDYGTLLTLDSLLNTIQELWTNTGTSTLTLTMGTANTSKLADVYVKLIPITDEMRAEDEYIDNKAPFVQCESTDEGAMLITEYVTTVKKWQLA